MNTEQDYAVQDNITEESAANTQQTILEKIEELDDKLNDINIERQNLCAQKQALEQEVTLLSRQKKKCRSSISKLKAGKVLGMLLFHYVAILSIIIITTALFLSEDSSDKDAISAEYDKKISDLDLSLNDLIQQKKEVSNTLIQQKHTMHLSARNTADTILTEDNGKELDAYIASLNRYPSKQVTQKELDGISYYEVLQKYDLGQYLLSDSGNSAIYPGAIVSGDSLMRGTADYALVSQPRTPMTLVCSSGGNAIQLDHVSYGTAKDAVKQLWDSSDKKIAEKWEYSLHSIKDVFSLNASLGIGNSMFSASGGINLSETTSTIAISFTETYFSVAAEPLSSATKYFQTGSDLKSLGEYEPAYVSSVDYGRMIIVLATANLSEADLKAELSANIKGVDIGADIGYIKENIDSDCQVFCYGGDSAQTLQAISNDEKSGGLKQWWDKLIYGEAEDISAANQMITSDSSLTNPLPLRYHLNYLSDNTSVPATAIISDTIISKDVARLMTISLEGDLPGTFRLSDSVNAIGYVVNADQIQINKKGETTGEIQFIWDSSKSGSLTGFFNDESFAFNLADVLEKPDSSFTLPLATKSFKGTNATIRISDKLYEIP